MCSDAPDTRGINKAATENAALSKEALAWYKQVYAEQAPARAAAEARAAEVSDAQVGAMNFATEQARELDAYNKSTFRPVEARLVEAATSFDTPERRAQAAAEAAADVDASAAAVQKAQDMELMRTGVAPGSARALALKQDQATSQVATRAGAMTNAVRGVEQQGYARLADVSNLGRGLATTQATQQQIATTSGNSGVASSQAALSSAMSGNATMGQGFQTAISANNSAGNLYGQAASINAQAQGDMLSGIAQLGSAGANIYKVASDKTKKKGTGKMADAAQALREVEKTPVHEGWEYDPAKGGPNEGGAKHDGPMAQDVRRTMGDKVAPGGKVIDLVSMNGKMMSAVQELSKRVKALEKEAA